MAASRHLGGTLVRNTLMQLLPLLVRMLLGLVLVAALARYLGVRGLGQYALVFAYVAVFSGIFSDWGLSTICLREISRGRLNRVELIGSAASLQALIAVGTYLLMLLSLVVVRYPAEVIYSIALYGLFILLSPINILGLQFQAELRVGRLVTPAIAGSLVGFAFVIGVIWMGGPLPALVGAALTGVLVENGWVTVISLRNIRNLRPSRSLWSFYLTEAWPLGLATVASTFIQQAPVLGISLLSLEGVGVFNAASRIPQQLNLLPMIVRNSTFPVVSEAWANDRARFRRLLDSLLGTSFFIAVPIALLGIGLAEPIVRVLFGPAFSAAVLPFKILMAAFAITFPAILLGEAMIAAGFQRMNLLVSLASVPVLLALLFSLLPRAGAVGAATVVLAIYSFIAAATLVTAPRLLQMPISMAPMILGTVAGALGGTILLLARDLGILPAAVLAASASAIVMGAADRSTLKLLWSLQPFSRPTHG